MKNWQFSIISGFLLWIVADTAKLAHDTGGHDLTTLIGTITVLVGIVEASTELYRDWRKK